MPTGLHVPFASTISRINSKPPNLCTGSGLGAVIILSATEMVKQARSILSTNKETKLESETHPSTNERLKRIAALDLSAPEDYRMAYADLCNSFREILADLWNELKPTSTSFISQAFVQFGTGHSPQSGCRSRPEL